MRKFALGDFCSERLTIPPLRNYDNRIDITHKVIKAPDLSAAQMSGKTEVNAQYWRRAASEDPQQLLVRGRLVERTQGR